MRFLLAVYLAAIARPVSHIAGTSISGHTFTKWIRRSAAPIAGFFPLLAEKAGPVLIELALCNRSCRVVFSFLRFHANLALSTHSVSSSSAILPCVCAGRHRFYWHCSSAALIVPESNSSLLSLRSVFSLRIALIHCYHCLTSATPKCFYHHRSVLSLQTFSTLLVLSLMRKIWSYFVHINNMLFLWLMPIKFYRRETAREFTAFL